MGLAAGTIMGQYEIRSALGAGGMGEVYRAHDTRLDRYVAIKVLPEYLTSDPERLCRFEQEARATAALNHPNILAVYQMATENGISYLVEELLEGETLRERLRRGPIPLRKAIDYAVQIAHGLAAAHDKGIVHRDLKPENLFLTKDGRVKILDFGLARVGATREASGDEATVTAKTEPGKVMGTAGYMSPEQVRGNRVDHRTDIFAFGTTLYEMITGKQPFRKATSAETMSAILNEEPPPLSQISDNTPPGLQRFVHRCLEKNPEQRFHSAHDLAFALEELSDSAITASSGVYPQHDEVAKRTRIFLAASALAVVVVAAVFAYWWMQPPVVPKISNFVRLTQDGQPKAVVGTDGTRLYLYVALPNYQGLAEMSVSGGQWKKLPILASANMNPFQLSSTASELLVNDGQGNPPIGPLWSIPLLGGSPRRLGEVEGQFAAWSRDGNWLAIADDKDLLVAKADGTEPHKIATFPWPLGYLAWSPEGDNIRLTMMGLPINLGEIWEVSRDGRNPHALFPGWHNPAHQCCGFWTTDGKYYLFLSNHQIFALPRNLGVLHHTPKPVQITSSPMPLSPPIPSKDGKKLFVVGGTELGELSRYDTKTGRFTKFLDGISAEYLVSSHDGQLVAYVSYPQGTLWRMKRDGTDRVQLTFQPSQAMLPRWSPDDKAIVFYELSPNQPGKMYEIAADGVTPHAVLPGDTSPQADPNWSPDGTKILFGGLADDPKATLRVLDRSTHQVSTLPGSQSMFGPRWSPSGRYIVAQTSDSRKLRLFDPRTQTWTDLVTKGLVGWPTWSKNEQYLYYMDNSGPGGGIVFRVRISDNKIEQVADLRSFVTTGFYNSWLGLAEDDSPLLLLDIGTQDVYSLDWEEP